MTQLPYEREDDARQSLSVWQRWTGEGPQDRWPYPDKHVKSLASGELADRIRRAFGADPDANVYITETIEYGGTEYTQNNFRWILISCGDTEQRFEETGWTSAFTLLLDWLDENSPARHCDTCTCAH